MPQKQPVTKKLLELAVTLQNVSELSRSCLAGGTALALLKGFRKSIDIDLFTQDDIKGNAVETILMENFSKHYNKTLVKTEHSLTCLINNIKVDILKYEYPILEKPLIIENIKVFSIPDIIAMKLDAIAGNGTRAKDFVDIYFLSKEYPLKFMLSCYEKKYKHDSFQALKSLTYFNDIDSNSWEAIELLTGEKMAKKTIMKTLSDFVLAYEK